MFWLSSDPKKALQQGLPQASGSSPLMSKMPTGQSPLMSVAPKATTTPLKPKITPSITGWLEGMNAPLATTIYNEKWIGTDTSASNWWNEVKQNIKQDIVTQGMQSPQVSTQPQPQWELPSADFKQPIGELWATILANPDADVEETKAKFPEFAHVDTQVFGELGATINANPDISVEEIMQKFPELSSKEQASTLMWGIKWWASRQWALDMWKTEWINPIGKTFEELDNQVQKIWAIDFTKWREEALNQRVANLSESDLQKYQQDWNEYKKSNPNLSKLFSKTVEWDNLVSQMWNIVTWKTKDRSEIDAFKDFVREREKGFVDQLVWTDTKWPRFANMMANVPSSALKTISAVTRWLTNPVDTMAGIYTLVATPEGRNAVKERYGSWDWFAKAMEQDPVWVASDALTLVEWWASLVKMWAKAAWATSLAAKAWEIAKTANVAGNLWADLLVWAGKEALLWATKWSKVANLVAKTAIAPTEPLKTLVSWAKSVAKWLPSAENTLQRMNRLTKWEQEKFRVMVWEDQGKWLNDRGIVWAPEETIAKLSEYFKENKAKVDEWLNKIQWSFKNEDLSLMSDDTVRYAQNTRDPWLNRMKQLNEKLNAEWLNMSEINELKRYFEQKNKFSYGRDMSAWEKTARATNVDSAVRERQMKTAEENGFTNLKEMNKETQASKFIMDKLAKNEQWRLGNNAVTITDWIVAAPAMVDPTLLAWLVAKKVFSSNWFSKNYAKIINKLNWHKNIANKVADLATISKIQNENQLNDWLKKWLENKQKRIDENLFTKQQKSIQMKQEAFNKQTKALPSPETASKSNLGTKENPIQLWMKKKEIKEILPFKNKDVNSSTSSNSSNGNNKILWEQVKQPLPNKNNPLVKNKLEKRPKK